MSDKLVELPLNDARAQELGLSVEQGLEGDWQLPGFWSQVGLDYANTRDDVEDEEDSWAFTDALVLRYVLRRVEAERPDARPVPRDIAVRLGEAPADARQEVALQTAIDVAATRIPEIRTLSGNIWNEFEYWASQFNAMRSRGRRREIYESAGVEFPPVPSHVDCDAALTFGYALRCCEEASNFDREETRALTRGPLTRGEAEANTQDDADEPAQGVAPTADFDPLDPGRVDASSAAKDLLLRTEAIFVGIRAPSRIGVAINTVALKGGGIEEGHPQYGPALGATLFGYAVRMAQEETAPLPVDEVDQVNTSLPRAGEGSVDYEAMADDAGALSELLAYAGMLADDQMRILRLVRVPREAWVQFAPLAAEQLRRNLRRNGLKRRFLPSAEEIESLMRLGCAIRVIDEVAGEAPLPASAL